MEQQVTKLDFVATIIGGRKLLRLIINQTRELGLFCRFHHHYK